jgi:nicotine blue oxidoreductase
LTTVGVVLAAGSGSRFGGPKAPVMWRGERLVDRAVRVLREGGCDEVFVVLGAWQGEVADSQVVFNPDWQTGMGSSFRMGLNALADTEADRALITLVDLPGLTSEAVARILNNPATAVSAVYNGVRGHPVMLARTHWTAAAQWADGDRGARVFLDALGDELILVEVGDVASPNDVDFATDLPSDS